MTNADRISELYKGEIWEARVQRVARARIEWLVGQARGMVLDVGCSQGIASVLCARRGLRTVGVDIEPDRIDYALTDRAAEPEAVRELVEFRVCDARTLPLADASVDTVLLGEVVEHHVDASPILAEAVRVLRPEGCLALTTPFGYFPHHDHRATFFVGSLLELLAPFVTVNSLNMVDGYFRVTARPGPMQRESLRDLVAQQQPVLEHEFATAQRELRENRTLAADLTTRLAAAKRELDATAKRLDLAQRQHSARLEKLETRLATTQERDSRRIAQIAESVGQLTKTQEHLRATVDRQRETNAKLRQELMSARAFREEMLGELRATALRSWKMEGRLRHQKYRTQYVIWQLDSSFNRRWWRIGKILWTVQRRPIRVLKIPVDFWRAAKKQPRIEPPRRPDPPRRPQVLKQRIGPTPASSIALRGERETVVIDPASAIGSASVADPIAMLGIPEISLPDGPIARPTLTVAVILDPFSAIAFRYEWRQVEPGPDDWRQVMERERPRVLFVESAWKGNGGRWAKHVQGPSGPSEELRELVVWCRQQNIPTVFWSKEDPPNFEFFIDAAKLFDHVFTVDGDSVPRYQEILGHGRVAVLPFAAQPRIHNPISVDHGRRHDVAFAGTYYAHKHPRRSEQMHTVLEPAREFGLHIFSRVSGTNKRYHFPAQYDGHVKGTLPYERMLAAYKSYKVFLNVNSVLDSPTMCARRVFELAACGTPIVSGYAKAIEEMLGDVVPLTRSGEETRALLGDLLASSQLRDRLAHVAMREVFARHTYRHRVAAILESLGMPDNNPASTVSVISVSSGVHQLTHIIEQVARQRYQPLQLVLVLHGLDLDPEVVNDKAVAAGIANVVVLKAEQHKTIGECLNLAIAAADGDLIATFDDNDIYGANFLSDLLLAFSYTTAEIIGKSSVYAHLRPVGATLLRRPENEHTYVDLVAAGTMMSGVDLLREIPFPVDGGENESIWLQQRARQRGARIYSADRFSYVRVHTTETTRRIWTLSDSDLLRTGRVEFYGPAEDHALI